MTGSGLPRKIAASVSQSSPQRSTRTFLLLLGALLASLAIAEVMLRVIGFSYPSFYRGDPDTGGALRPGAKGWWTGEGRGWVEINSHGQRDREHSEAKPPGTFRIAVLGDSYAEAFQLPMEQSFWSVLEKRLNGDRASCGRTVEVLNFGVSGYGTAQELLALRNRVWTFSPDLVLLTITTGNDIRNNAKALEGNPDIPYFHFEGNRLVLDAGYRSSRRYRAPWRQALAGFSSLSDHSRSVQLANRARHAYQNRKSAQRLEEAAVRAGAEIGLDAMVFRPPEDQAWQDAWAVTEALIAQMDREVRGREARFLVATLSSAIQVHPDPRVPGAVAAQLGVPDLYYPDRRLISFCGEAGIPAVSLAPGLARVATERQLFLHGFGRTLGSGHWNAAGHRFAGERLAGAVRELCEGNPTPE